MRKFCSMFYVLCSMLIVISVLHAEQEGNITLDFKDADIQSVLRILSEKGNVNIVSARDVVGTVTMRLSDVPWQKALDVILRTYGYGYEREGNIITVTPLGKLTEQKKAEKELTEVQPVVTEVFTLKYLDANDAKKVIDPQLSPRGKVTVVEVKGKKGWRFGAATAGGTGSPAAGGGKLERVEGEEARSKTLIVSEIPPYMEKIREVLSKIDVMPRQILIETKIVEVNKDKLKDFGIDWGTGSSGATSTDISTISLRKTKEAAADRRTSEAIGAHDLVSQKDPSIFNPKTTGLSPTNTGLKILYQKLTGNQFEVVLHALEEEVGVNTLSNPRIMTLDNQEATILVGTKYPILEANVSGTESTTTTSTLKYYQDIGIQLNVVPQISGDNLINMIVHPAVTSYTETLKASGGAEYPILNVREAETQILMKDGETIVIGGLLKDVKSKGKFSVPILGKIPLLGMLFTRETIDTEKIDLLIFITAKIMESPST